MIVLLRFRVSEQESERFQEQARAAVDVLAERTGFLTADLGRNLDEPALWTLTTRWRDVGSYRRALQGYESKTVVVPLLSLALDEPSAYEGPEAAGDMLGGDAWAGTAGSSAFDRRYPEGR
jgi:quinol monooxygenase YgiN